MEKVDDGDLSTLNKNPRKANESKYSKEVLKKKEMQINEKDVDVTALAAGKRDNKSKASNEVEKKEVEINEKDADVTVLAAGKRDNKSVLRYTSSVEEVLATLSSEILLRVPTKSIVVAQAVSKYWKHVVNKDNFRLQHTLSQKNLESSMLVLFGDSDVMFYVKAKAMAVKSVLPYTFGSEFEEYTKFVCGDNGFVLLEKKDQNTYAYSNQGMQQKMFMVCNLSTKQRKVIPVEGNKEFPYLADFIVCFDPSSSPFYKLAFLRSEEDFGDHISHQLMIYEAEYSAWEIKGGPFTFGRLDHGVYCNGSIWWMERATCLYRVFNFKNNNMHTVSFPLWMGSAEPDYTVAFLDSCVDGLFHMEVRGTIEDEEVLFIWKMVKVESNEWNIIVVNEVLPQENWLFSTSILKLLAQNNKMELLLYNQGVIRKYCLTKKSLNEICTLTFRSHLARAIAFGETLAPIENVKSSKVASASKPWE